MVNLQILEADANKVLGTLFNNLAVLKGDDLTTDQMRGILVLLDQVRKSGQIVIKAIDAAKEAREELDELYEKLNEVAMEGRPFA